MIKNYYENIKTGQHNLLNYDLNNYDSSTENEWPKELSDAEDEWSFNIENKWSEIVN